MHALGIPGVPNTFHSGLILPEVSKGRGNTWPVENAREQQLGSLIQFVLETLLSNLQNINDVGHGQEVLNVMKKVGPSICIREFCSDLTFAECLGSH